MQEQQDAAHGTKTRQDAAKKIQAVVRGKSQRAIDRGRGKNALIVQENVNEEDAAKK